MVSGTLPKDVLLGNDVSLVKDAFVMTRQQRRLAERQEAIELVKEVVSGVKPNELLDNETEMENKNDLNHGGDINGTNEFSEFDFDEDFFEETQDRRRKSKPHKRTEKGMDDDIHNLFESITTEEFISFQKEDASLRFCWKKSQTSQSNVPQNGSYFYAENGILHRCYRSGKCQCSSSDECQCSAKLNEQRQVVVPKRFRKQVMAMAHDIPFAGHMGRDKTVQRILDRFYWPGVYSEVERYCASCPQCQKTARPVKQRVPLVPIPPVSEPFSLLAMDIVGPLERTNSGNKYILVLVDYATRYPEAIPLRSIDAETIADELIRVFARVGVPQRILTDQGSNFTSTLMKQVANLLRINQIQTSPYHPQTDGLVERFNGTIKSMLRKFVKDAPKQWDELIPYLLFAYREVPQAATGFSPFELLYGRHVRGPLDILQSHWTGTSDSEEINVLAYVNQMKERFHCLTECVQENLSAAQRKDKTYYDKSSRQRSFQPGDRVLLLLPTSSRALQAAWQGPFKVVRKIGPVNYEIEMPRRRQKLKVFHVNMLRQWHERSTFFSLVQNDAEECKNEDIFNIPTSTIGEASCVNEIQFGQHLDEEQKNKLQNLVNEFSDVFSNQPGRTNVIEHRIILTTNKPIRQCPYRIPQAYREKVKKEIEEMEENGIIRKSKSEWASPLVIVPKKDGSLRLCVDFRRLNAVSEFDAYPMPLVEEVLDRMGSANYLSTLDMTKGYWQIPLAEESKDKTAFITPFGLYEFNVMPFGLHGAPATFQRLMDNLLMDQREAADAYIDDVTVANVTFDDHLRDLRKLFSSLRQAGLKVKPRKTHIGMEHVDLLGHHVGQGLIRPDAAKVNAVFNWPQPKTKSELRSFLGLVGYYRKFVPDFSELTSSLYDLLKKNMPEQLIWNSSLVYVFNSLKKLLCSEPVLLAPDFSKEFTLQTDASKNGLGAVLSQLDGNGADHPVAYASRKLRPAEKNYSTIEQECLAIKWAIDKFSNYLLGRTFIIETDHAPLKWLDQHQHNARVARWSLALQPYAFEIRHRSGARNQNADALSRV